jgi:hypothetical protein
MTVRIEIPTFLSSITACPKMTVRHRHMEPTMTLLPCPKKPDDRGCVPGGGIAAGYAAIRHIAEEHQPSRHPFLRRLRELTAAVAADPNLPGQIQVGGYRGGLAETPRSLVRNGTRREAYGRGVGWRLGSIGPHRQVGGARTRHKIDDRTQFHDVSRTRTDGLVGLMMRR